MTQTATNSPNLRQAIARRITHSTSARGRLVLPAAKRALDPYAQRLERLFATLGKPFSPTEIVQLCQNLAKALDRADTAGQAEGDSGDRVLALTYEPAAAPRQGLAYSLRVVPYKNPPQTLLTDGKIVLPCVPALCDDYLKQLGRLFDTLTYPMSQAQGDRLRERLQTALDDGFRLTPNARILVSYATVAPPQKGLSCQISVVSRSLADKSRDILQKFPDYPLQVPPLSKVVDLAQDFDPSQHAVLLAGVATAQHALPLARQGFAVRACDLAAPFAEQLQQVAAAENLPVTAAAEDLLDPLVSLPSQQYHLAILTEVLPRLPDVEAIAALLRHVAAALVPGGTLLLNLFLADDDVEFDRLALEAACAENATVLTRSQLHDLLDALPFQLADEVPVLTDEGDRRPADIPPLDPWYVRWASGQQVFALSTPPLALHWLTLTRDESPPAATPDATPEAAETQFL